LYASISDLRTVLDSTDAGTGTASQLTDVQLTLALQAGTNRVTTYAGEVYDPAANPPTMPGIIHDLTLDLAAWWATTYYLKQKDMGSNHPVVLRYTAAMEILTEVRKGLISLDATTTPGGAAASARVINRIPNIFDGDDSNTAVDPATGTLYAATPPDMMSRRMLGTVWLESW
jgi:hypothetical protein